VNRDEVLLISNDRSESFETAHTHRWIIPACPMSSASFFEGPMATLAAWETEG